MTQPLPLPRIQRGTSLVDRRGAQHPGPAHRHQHRAGGELGEVALEDDRAQVVGCGRRAGATLGHTSVLLVLDGDVDGLAERLGRLGCGLLADRWSARRG